jgi:hypothetical protein
MSDSILSEGRTTIHQSITTLFYWEMNILENLKEEEQDWLIFKQKINIPTFLSLNLKCSLYRCITNSRRKFRNKTNREFFRSNFSEGFYRSTILDNQFQYTYFLKTKHSIDKNKILSELKLRMKKMVYSNIEILNLSELPTEDQQLLTNQIGLSQYQKVLESYSNIRK